MAAATIVRVTVRNGKVETVKQEQVLLCDRDTLYAKALIQRLQEISKLKVEFMLFTEYESMQSYIESHTVALVVMEETLYKQVPLEYEGHILFLSEEVVSTEETKRIFKYQAIQNICEQMEQYYVKQIQPTVSVTHETVMITALSYVDQGMNSFLAYAIGTECSKSKKTILINLEVFPYEPPHEPIQYTLSDLIYYLNTRQLEDMPNIEEYIYQVGQLDCISPATYYKDLYQMGKEEFDRLIQYLQMQKQYERVVVIADVIFTYLVELLDYSNQIIVPTLGDAITKKKEQSFIRMLQVEKKENVLEKIKKVAIPEQYRYEVQKGGEVSWEIAASMVRAILV